MLPLILKSDSCMMIWAIGDGNSDYSGVMEFIKTFPDIVTLEVVHISTSPSVILKSRDNFKNLLDG